MYRVCRLAVDREKSRMQEEVEEKVKQVRPNPRAETEGPVATIT